MQINDLIERGIEAVSPQWALKRQRARFALGYMAKNYEGAKTGRRTGGWTTGSTSADSEIAPDLVRLRNRSRDLIRNNPYARRARDVFSSNVVGTGIVAKVPKEAQAAWDAWCRECDADGLLDIYGIQALVGDTLFESGEALIRFRIRRTEDGMTVPLALQVLEPDYLDTSKTGAATGGGWYANGIEYNAIGQRVAYWLFNTHPGDANKIGKSLVSRAVPADEVLHIFKRERPGQNRGVPRLAASILRMRDLDDYEEAELVRKGIESCFAAFVTTEDEGQQMGPAETGSDGRRIESLGAGMIQYLKPGQGVEFGAPNASGGYAEYTRTQLRAIAAGIGITYEQLTGDLTGVNYSSIRAGMVEFNRAVDAMQWLVLVPMMLDPIWRRWSALAYELRVIKTKAADNVQWTPPRRQWVDPLKDVNAARSEIGAGIVSLSETIRSRGEDPDKVFAEIAAERKTLADLGILSDVVATPPAPPDPEQTKAASEMRDQLAQYAERLASIDGEVRALRAVPAQPAAVHYHVAQGGVVHQAETRTEINVPQQAAPVVEVRNEPAVINVAAPNVDVTVEAVMPDEMKTTIVAMPDRETTSELVRDANGNIKKSTQIERDA
jgi:lambda family phage portal protein